MESEPSLAPASEPASECVQLALVSQGLHTSYSMDYYDPGRYDRLLFELYNPYTGLLALGGRGEERLRSERCRGLWGPELSAHSHGSVVMWRCMCDSWDIACA